jgi:UDP-N-acetylenolpyruvoylglucosamine reductase
LLDIYIIIEFLALNIFYGIPGTIGGALYMNAGAFDEEILLMYTRIKL